MHFPSCISITFTFVLTFDLFAAHAIPHTSNEGFDISDRYIVALRQGVDLKKHVQTVQELQAPTNSNTKLVFGGISDQYEIGDFHGYSGHFNTSDIVHLRSHPDVAYVEADQMLEAQTGVVEECCNGNSCSGKERRAVQTHYEANNEPISPKAPIAPPENLIKQSNAPWNLVRISHRNLNTQGRQSTHYWYASSAGAGTFVYILDSGINAKHLEFTNRPLATQSQGGFENGFHTFEDQPVDGPPVDNHGHGTYIAAIIGGRNFGVAKSTTLVPVKIYDQQLRTPVSRLLKGYTWAVDDISSKNRIQHAAINLSISGKYSRVLNNAIDAAFNKGIVTAVPAGDQDSNARLMSPASSIRAISVGSTDRNRVRLPSSNWGPRVNIFAPGQKICSAWGGNERMIRSTSGTAAAAAQVSGLIAYFKSFYHLRTAQTTYEFLKISSIHGVVKNVKQGNDMFAYNFSGR